MLEANDIKIIKELLNETLDEKLDQKFDEKLAPINQELKNLGDKFDNLENKFDDMLEIVNDSFTHVQEQIDEIKDDVAELKVEMAKRPTTTEMFSWADNRIIELEVARDRHDYLHLADLDKLPTQREINIALINHGVKQVAK